MRAIHGPIQRPRAEGSCERSAQALAPLATGRQFVNSPLSDQAHEGYSRADPATAGRRLVRAIGTGAGAFGDRTAVREWPLSDQAGWSCGLLWPVGLLQMLQIFEQAGRADSGATTTAKGVRTCTTTMTTSR